jgi:hypothetical protein
MPLLSTRRSFLNVERLERRDTPATLYALTDDNRIVQIDSANPSAATVSAPIDVGSAQWRVAGLAYRPRTDELFALILERSESNDGRTSMVTALVYDLHLMTTNVSAYTPPRLIISTTPVGSTNFNADYNADYGFSFDPITDQARVTNSRGFNCRIALQSPGGAAVDTPINPAGQQVSSIAFDRNFDSKLGPNGTTIYAVNSATANLQTLGGLNGTLGKDGGTQTVVGPLGTPIDPTGRVGLAIAARPTAGGSAFAVFDGDPTAGVSTGLYSINLATGAATRVGTVGNGTARIGALAVAPEGRFAAGSGAGTDSKVEVYDASTGALLHTFNPFPGFFGGVTTAVADVNRDSVPDVIVGAGPGGGPHVKVFDGSNGAELFGYFAYDQGFRGGVSVAGGDVNGDGYADIITGAGPGGGPHVRVFNWRTGSDLTNFYAYDAAFTGGVGVAAGDFDEDGAAEMVTGAGPGGGPHVRIFARDLLTGGVGIFNNPKVPVLRNFYAFDPNYRGGVNVATGYVEDNSPFMNIVTTPASGGMDPQVVVHSVLAPIPYITFSPFEGYTGVVRVGVADVNRDGQSEVLASGPDTTVKAYVTGGNPPTGLLKTFSVLAGASNISVGGGSV